MSQTLRHRSSLIPCVDLGAGRQVIAKPPHLMRQSWSGWEVAVRALGSVGLTLTLMTGVACDSLREMGGVLKDLQTLQTGLIATFHEPRVTVNVNNGQYLTIIFVNAALAAQPEETRAAAARQAAEYVRDHYPRYGELTGIAVGFRQEAGAAGFSMSSQQVPYQFTTADLGPAPTAADTTATRAS